MKYFKNILKSFFFKSLPVILFLFFAHISYSQENDDLYFNKNDRKIREKPKGNNNWCLLSQLLNVGVNPRIQYGNPAKNVLKIPNPNNL